MPLPVVLTFLIALASAAGLTNVGKKSAKPVGFLVTLERYALFLVGGHVVLGTILLVTDATYGLSDMDGSFLIVLLVHYLNLPTSCVLGLLRVDLGWVGVILGGIL